MIYDHDMISATEFWASADEKEFHLFFMGINISLFLVFLEMESACPYIQEKEI